MAAGLALLRALRDRDAFATLDERGARLAATLEQAAADAGVRAAVSRVGSLVTLFHLSEGDERAPRNFDEAQRLDTARFGRMHAGCLTRGHHLPASQFEALFASTTHTDEMIDSLGEAVRDSLAAGARA